jgi:hypothetical protein
LFSLRHSGTISSSGARVQATYQSRWCSAPWRSAISIT